MSGFEVAGVILALYPALKLMADSYKAIKPGRSARKISRDLDTQAVIYEGILKELLASVLPEEAVKRLMKDKSSGSSLWEELNLRGKLRRRLGTDKLRLTLEYLTEISRVLEILRTDLNNMNRGTVRYIFYCPSKILYISRLKE
jgi:hypothetical protein